MNEILQSILRTSLSYILLIGVAAFCGKQINSHKNHFNFALSVTIGSFIANMGFDTNLAFTPMFFSFITLTVLYFLSSIISLKRRNLRKWVSGKPILFIQNGNILDENLKKSRFSIDDLNQQFREQGIFDMSEIEYAFLEVSGNISILKKEPFRNVLLKDISTNFSQNRPLPIELIMDGKIVEENLTSEYSCDWIHSECQKRMVQINEVYYAVIGTNGRVYFDLYKDKPLS
ncbi:MAG: DUF421 domain-containing protein [Bacillota bacterium]|nr:DUF421 domain-containing protein [Bacillota bacterium]